MVNLHCTLHTDKNQKEITRHGSVLFPVACYEDDMACTDVPSIGTMNLNTSWRSTGPSISMSAQSQSRCGREQAS